MSDVVNATPSLKIYKQTCGGVRKLNERGRRNPRGACS